MPYHIAPEVVIDATLYTLLIFSLITWTLIFFKIWQFTKNSYYNKNYAATFWGAVDLKTAEQASANKAHVPKARIAMRGFAWLAEMNRAETSPTLRFSGSPRNVLEQTLRKQTQDEQRLMECGLTMLASIGSTAPFVGLFGTVLGIMHAMHEITASGSSSLDVVAGPIGDALIATAIGIAVAVPAVLAYNFFIRSAKHHKISLENFVDSFLLIAISDKASKE